MPKIIKIKESELRNLVKQVISEAQNKDPKVIAVQNALKRAGFGKYLGTSGDLKDGVDGVFGNSTKNAVIQYQLKNGIQPAMGVVGPVTSKKLGVEPLVGGNPGQTTKTSSVGAEVGKVGKGAAVGATGGTTAKKEEEGFFSSMVTVIKNAAQKVNDFFSLPLHIRAFMYFSTLRKKPMTINELKTDEKSALKDMINYGVKNKMLKFGKQVDFYSIANSMNKGGGEQINFKDKEKLGLNQTDVKSNYTRIALTIGNAMVVKNVGMYKITDTYDFNNYAQNPEKYTLDQTPETLRTAFKKMGSGNWVQGVEELASYYQKLGYGGYQVDIDLPSGEITTT